MRRFRRLNQVNDDIPVKVMRDGAMHEVPRRDVVVGDVVYIGAARRCLSTASWSRPCR